MMTRCGMLLALLLVAGVVEADSKKLLLRYKFSPDQPLSWEVTNRVEMKTTVSGHTQRTSTLSTSTKKWTPKAIDGNGEATLINTVERVRMRQQFSGRAPVEYDSSTDKTPPAGFEGVAGSVGVPLTEFSLDPRGAVGSRKALHRGPGLDSEAARQPTMPLPERAVGVGDTWEVPYPIRVPTESGAVVTVQARDFFRVESITGHQVKIFTETQILSPVDRPDVRVKLVQQSGRGHIWFDAELGAIRRVELTVDDEVIGFQGAASSLRYQSHFEERLVD